MRWLRLGNAQLHLFLSDGPAPRGHHFAVDDFEAVYGKANELNSREGNGFFANVWELPDGAVQLYLRDPAGNLVEVNWPDVNTLDRSVVTDIRPHPEPQTGDALRSTLYLTARKEPPTSRR